MSVVLRTNKFKTNWIQGSNCETGNGFKEDHEVQHVQLPLDQFSSIENSLKSADGSAN